MLSLKGDDTELQSYSKKSVGRCGLEQIVKSNTLSYVWRKEHTTCLVKVKYMHGKTQKDITVGIREQTAFMYDVFYIPNVKRVKVRISSGSNRALEIYSKIFRGVSYKAQGSISGPLNGLV